jgi:adenine-specific DNA-methyltransferase
MENMNDYMPLSNDWNKERLATLKQLFPDLFTNEGKLNLDELKKVADPESVSETERYEFRWFGKSQAKRNAFTPSNATLVYDENRSVSPTESDNLIIEGENLEVLKLLSTGYREKIKCIYIDPPYNTGNDFVYSDNFSQDKNAYWEDAGVVENGLKIDTNTETDGRYHSNWLNMMYSRLLIARQLLKEDGVIFISIDDHEVHHLRKLCDEVFGEDNFVAEFIWKSRQNKDNRTLTGVSTDHEYIVCYSKNFDERALRGAERKVEQYTNPDNDTRGVWVSANMVGLKNETERPNLHYDLINTETGINYGRPRMGWRYDSTSMSRLIEEKRILWPETSEGRPRRKVFLNELSDNLPGYSSLVGDEIYTRNGTAELDLIFGVRVFDFPKPSSLIAELIDQVVENGDIVVDFFAGSGSTLQAILNMNQQNGRNINFIGIQLPETTDEKSEAYKAGFKKISDITIERNKRVIEKLIEEKKTQQPDLFTNKNQEDALKGLGFKVFKLVKSNFPRVEYAPDPEKTDEENIELLKKYISEKEAQLVTSFNRDELMTEILLKKGFNLNYTVALHQEFKGQLAGKTGTYVQRIDIVNDGEKETLICMDEFLLNETIEYFKNHINRKFICLERALDTTKKYNLKHYMGDNFIAF